MIIDLERFAAAEREYWEELDRTLGRLERDPMHRLDLAGAERLYYLYQRACADLSRLATFSAEPELRRHLEALIARAYGELHDSRRGGGAARIRPLHWFFGTLPRTFRRHLNAFWLALAVTVAGIGFGCLGLAMDDEAKEVILPSQFSNLSGRPSERVAREEAVGGRHLSGRKSSFSSELMANNIHVAINSLALGLTWGVGTLIFLFYNGVILGAVAFDYIRDGQTVFLLGWLLPHGTIEIPSFLLAGQAGLVLGGALIGWGRRERLRERMRAVAPDLATLIGGVALMLVWAGIVEAFFSQYHQPVLPYWLKIAFGLAELVLLIAFLSQSGKRALPGDEAEAEPAKT